MSYVLDSYSETNQSGSIDLVSVGNSVGAAQSVVPSFNGVILDSIQFYLKKTGTPTGNAMAYVYTCKGIHGSTAIPFDASSGALAVSSDILDVSTLTTSYQLITFNFTGDDRVSLYADRVYGVAIEYSSGTAFNNVNVGVDTSSPSHVGNGSRKASHADPELWETQTSDMCFYLYVEDPTERVDSTALNLTQGFA